MLDRFRSHVASSGLLAPGSAVLVGYSGGADSTCLLHLLVESGHQTTAVHLHHEMRPEADSEADLCRETAQSIGAGFIPGKADVPGLAKARKIGLEEAGREARYAFFEQCALQTGVPVCATAHTLDDLVETQYMNFMRGTGLKGLAGIPSRRGRYIRPLLPFHRIETRQFCEERGLWFHDDPANFDMANRRTWLRLCLLPEIERLFPAYRESADKLASIAIEEDSLLDALAARALEDCELRPNGALSFLTEDQEVVLDRQRLISQPLPLVRRGLRLLGAAMGGTLDFDQTETIRSGLLNEPKGSVTTEGGSVVFVWDDTTIRAEQIPVVVPERTVLPSHTSVQSARFGWEYSVGADASGVFELKTEIDLAKVSGGLSIRTATSEDWMVPLNSPHRKRVVEIFSEMGLTPRARRILPVLCDMLGPIWIPGGRMADRVKLTENKQGAATVTFGPYRPGTD